MNPHAGLFSNIRDYCIIIYATYALFQSAILPITFAGTLVKKIQYIKMIIENIRALQAAPLSSNE